MKLANHYCENVAMYTYTRYEHITEQANSDNICPPPFKNFPNMIKSKDI